MVNQVTDFYKGRKVLITGHTGFKGSWLSMLLHHMGAEVYGYALDPPTQPSLYTEARIGGIVHSQMGDVRNYNLLLATMRSIEPEIVIHMAAQPLVRQSYLNPVETYEVNIMGTVYLLEACRNVPSVKAILNVTSDKCYENLEIPRGYHEDDPMGGFDPYSSSKGCSELVTAAYRNSYFSLAEGIAENTASVATARAGNVIGGGDWANDRLIPDFVRSTIRGEEVIIRYPYAIRPWQHVLEPLYGYLLLAMKLYREGSRFAEPWNFGPKQESVKSVAWMVEHLCKVWGGDASFTIDADSHFHEAGLLQLDCSKAAAKLGWNSVWETESVLFLVVSWYKAFYAGQDMQSFSLRQIENYLSTLNNLYA